MASSAASQFNTTGQKMLLAGMLASPVHYSEESLYPFTAPVLNQALTVGQILLCVFALIITNVTFGPVNFIPFVRSAKPGVDLALRRLAVILLLAMMVGVAYSTILIGIANKTNITMNGQSSKYSSQATQATHPTPYPIYFTFAVVPGVTYGASAAQGSFSGSIWAQVWATQWLETSIFAASTQNYTPPAQPKPLITSDNLVGFVPPLHRYGSPSL